MGKRVSKVCSKLAQSMREIKGKPIEWPIEVMIPEAKEGTGLGLATYAVEGHEYGSCEGYTLGDGVIHEINEEGECIIGGCDYSKEIGGK